MKNQYIGGQEEGGVFEGGIDTPRQDGTAILKNMKTNFVRRRTLVKSFE